MTIAALGPVPRPLLGPPVLDDGTTWRALADGLRVARRDGRHLGSIERGRRFRAVDADGEPIGAFRSLREAQEAVEDPDMHRSSVRSAAGVAGPGVAGLGAAVAVLLISVVLSAAGSTWIGPLL